MIIRVAANLLLLAGLAYYTIQANWLDRDRQTLAAGGNARSRQS